MKSKKIKKIKNHTADSIEKVHGWTFVIFEIIVYIVIDRILLDRFLPDNIWAEIIRAVAFGLGYFIIYILVKGAYGKFGKSNLPFDGTWYHVHIPDTSLLAKQGHIESLSAGTTQISRNLNDFTFRGKNYRYTVDQDENIFVINSFGVYCTEEKDGEFYTVDKNGSKTKAVIEPRTIWRTETSELSDEKDWDIVEIYRASSTQNQTVEVRQCPVCGRNYSKPRIIAEAPKHRYGIHLYDMDDNKRKIVCTYSDCYPSLKSGKLYLFRDRSDRDAKIKEFFRNNQLNAQQQT